MISLKNIIGFNAESPLLFTHLYFWVFFTIVLTGYSIIYKNKSIRSIYLFFISLFFYYKTSGNYFLLLIFSTIADFYIGKFIYKINSVVAKKLLVTLSIIINLGMLAYFKYSYLFIETINEFLGLNIEVVNLFAQWSNNFLNSHYDINTIILPVGISFFTFQTISYSIDIYRNKVKPVKNILDFGFYVSFFPQLVAGPIVRASEFIPQIYKKYRVSEKEFGMAVYLIIKGLTKKMFIGDYIAVNFVDRVFANPISYSSFEDIVALFGYSLQVYCDFSGYTDVAIGVALLMGFSLPKNFNSPYKAVHCGEFWKRWHISLSTWLRDYLYIPLGGSRKGEIRTSINLMITMLLGGLWHGADWKFVTWGGLNGLGIIIYKYWKRISPYENSNHPLIRAWRILLTFTFITFTRIWFRADSWQLSMQMLRGIFRKTEIQLIAQMSLSYYKVFVVMLIGFVIHWLPDSLKCQYRDWFINTPIWLKILIVVVVIFIIYQTYSSDLQPFIYFQF